MATVARPFFATLWGTLVLVALCLLLAWPWTHYGYGRSHIEWQGADLVNHLIITYQLAIHDDHNRTVLDHHVTYPTFSHRFAILASSLFDDNLLLGLRYMAALSMLLLLLLPYVLLCRCLRPVTAFAVLAAWHLLCYRLRIDGVNHFLWEGQYNYSRAVGTVGFWLAAIFVTTPAASPWTRSLLWLLAIASACGALAAHIAPGAVAFGTTLLWYALAWLQERQRESLVLLLGTGLSAAAMYVGTDVWVYMSVNAAADGFLPVGPLALLVLWVPVVIFAAVRCLRAVLGGQAAALRLEPIEQVLFAGLLTSGALQAYLTCKLVVSASCAPYAIKSIFFFTFPLAVLLLLLWLRRFEVLHSWYARLPRARWLTLLLGLGLTYALGANMYRRDLGMRHEVRRPDLLEPAVLPPRECLPHQIALAVKEIAPTHGGWYYHDPLQPAAAFYATVLHLGVERCCAFDCFMELSMQRGRVDPRPLTKARVHGVLLPGHLDPAQLPPCAGPAERVGRFWKCRLAPETLDDPRTALTATNGQPTPR